MNAAQRRMWINDAKYLATLPPEGDESLGLKWDMGEWKCGSAACAIGHIFTRNCGRELKLQDKQGDHGEFQPVFGNIMNFEAVQDFYGITEEHCLYCFANSYYVFKEATPEQVSDRMMEVLKEQDNES